MNTLEKAVLTDFTFDESTSLINVVTYKLSQKLGKQVVTERFIDLLEVAENGNLVPETAPALEPSLETSMNALATRVHQALVKQFSTEWQDVKVNVVLARWMKSRDNDLPVPYIGFQVSVEAEDAHLVNFHADFSILNDAFYPVELALMPKPDEVTEDVPVRLLETSAIKDLCQVDVVDAEVLDSISIAALAIGWVDTEVYGRSVLLLG